jgi:hypothetical protein
LFFDILRQAFQATYPEEETQRQTDVTEDPLQTEVTEIESVPKDAETVAPPHAEHDGLYIIEKILKRRKYSKKMQ